MGIANSKSISKKEIQLAPPISTESPANPKKENKIETKTNEIANKKFSEKTEKKSNNVFKKIFKFIKSIPTKIADLFRKCLIENDAVFETNNFTPNKTDRQSIDIIDENNYEETSQSSSSELSESSSSSETSSLSSSEIEINKADQIRKNLSSLYQGNKNQISLFIQDWTMLAFNLQIELDRDNYSSVKLAIDAAKESEVLDTLLEFVAESNDSTLKKEVDRLYPLLEKLFNQAYKLAATQKEYKQTIYPIFAVPELPAVDSKPNSEINHLQKPPSFHNTDNKCWFHSSLELMTILGSDLFDLIDQKMLSIDSLEEQYHKKWPDYTKLETQYQNRIKAFKNFQAYKIDLEKYEKATKTYKKYRANLKIFREKRALHEKWLEEGSIGKEPKVQIRPEKVLKPQKPAKVEEVIKPYYINLKPANQAALLYSLYYYKEAVLKGNIKNIRRAADILYHTVSYHSAAFLKKGYQHDAAEFLEVIFSLLTTSIYKTKHIFKGLENTPAEGFQLLPKDESQVIMTIPYRDRKKQKIELQDLIIAEYSPEKFDSTVTLEKGQEQVKFEGSEGIVVEQTIITSEAPEFFVVQTKRFLNLFDKEGQPYNKKIETKVHTPENEIISLAKAFNKEGSSDYDYEIVASVLHKGSLNLGHYTAAVKNDKNQWFFCNDQGQIVEPISSSTARQKMETGYFYLLKKVKKN